MIRQAIGLGDYGKATGFVERQVARWSKQYLADAEAGRVPAMDRLVDWLGKHLPPDSGARASSTAIFAATT